jgi:phosphatidylinositol alpha-1,6-mannosyltransferase
VCEGFTRHSLLLQPWHRVYALSKRIAEKDGFSVFIISDKNPNSNQLEEIDGITVTRVNRLALLGIFGRRELEKAILKNNPHVIVWYGSPLSATYLNQLRKVGKPVIWDIDMDIPNLRALSCLSVREILNFDHNFFIPQLLAIVYPKFIMKRIANSDFIRRVLVPSQFLKNSIRRIGANPEKIRVLPSAIEKEECNNTGRENLSRSEFGFRPDEFIVTYFGSPCTLRGTDTAILGMRRIVSSKTNVKLVLLSRRGTGNTLGGNRHLKKEEEHLKKLIKRLGLTRNVQILPGIMNKSQLIRFLLVSDVVVLPFKIVFSEPPLSVLEAMSLGKVVITTNLGTLAEMVGDGRGLLIEPNDAKALAHAVLYLADHPHQAAQIGKKAKQFVAGLGDWDRVAHDFEELLGEVITNKGD